MTDYVVGDIQGCCDSLIALLDKVNFDPQLDHLYCVGDLINRGPKSLGTLEFLFSLGNSVSTVLGNHDIHLISCYYKIRSLKKQDTAQEILNSSSASFWVNWFCQQPLMIHNEKKNFIIAHAGIYPHWSIEEALIFSILFSNQLKSDKVLILLEKIYDNKPNIFSKCTSEDEYLRFIINAFTRMRFCYKNGRLDFSNKSFPSDKHNPELIPWYCLQQKVDPSTRIIFGHWSSLGLYHRNNIICIDTGCVWGNELTLYNIDQDCFIQQKSID